MAMRFEVWKQAVLDMERAIAELDQVQASLKDIRLDRLGFEPRPNIAQLIIDADRLVAELRNAACDECCHAIIKHGTPDGCDAVVLLLGTPCGCRWGLEEAGPRS
jgi:hypothetical protein